MKKKKIRCYKTLANVYPGVNNYTVYFLVYEGWSNFSLTTCLNCGELFVIDWENHITNGSSIVEVAGSCTCPTCNSLLKDTLRNYPQSIRLPNGNIGSFTPDNFIPADEESLILEVFEITPE